MILPGHELSVVVTEDVDEKLLRNYYEHVREKERAIDSEWGGRPIEKRADYSEDVRRRAGGRIVTCNWVDQELLNVIDAEAVRAVFCPDGAGEYTIFDSGRITVLLESFCDVRDEYVERRPPRTNPRLRFEGTYVAPLEFALERGCGIRWNF